MVLGSKTELRWVDKGRPGYFGRHRDEKFKEYDGEYGKGNWKIEWVVGSLRYGFLDTCRLYEDAYHAFLLSTPAVLQRLVHDASEVYDTEQSNIKSGRDYSVQEGDRTHIQDIAIRNVLHRMELEFQGPAPIRIRQEQGDHPLSVILSPGHVPFHRSELIVQPELQGWWHPGTVESFYQSNKMLRTLESITTQTA